MYVELGGLVALLCGRIKSISPSTGVSSEITTSTGTRNKEYTFTTPRCFLDRVNDPRETRL